jgi:hypothetical protein
MSGVRTGLQSFSMANLNEVGRPNPAVNGLWVQMIDAEIKRVLADIEDRPALEAKRKVKVVLEFVAVTGDTGTLDDIEVALIADSSVPAQQSRPFAFKPAAGAAEMLFSPAHAEGAALYEGTPADTTRGDGQEGGGSGE